MSRKQLLDISERFFRWIDSHDVNPDDLATFAAKDIVVSTPLPGTTPDFAGLIAYHTKVITGSSDFKLTLINALADEVESSVVHYIQVNGTHDGIWMGIPATGKKFQFQGIVINKIDLAKGLVVEHAAVFQDLSLLQQIGAIPATLG